MVRFALMSFALILVGCGEAAVSPPSDTQPGKQGGVAIATSTGEPDAPHTSTEWQIWAYSTASPTFISSNATAADGEMNVLREGTNGWMCLPANPRGMSDPESGWTDAHEAMPLCADEEGMKWVAAYLAGERPQLERDAIIWMLHGDMGEDNTTPLVMSQGEAEDPSQWIVSGPHLMIMPKDPESLDAYDTDFTLGSPYTMFAGTGYAHLMIPAEGYYRYQGQD